MFFCQHFAAEIKQGDGGVVTTKPYADCVEIAGFGDDGDSAAAPGGGLLINFFDQPAFDKLTRNFGYAGRGQADFARQSESARLARTGQSGDKLPRC